MLQVGSILSNRYRILANLARGGMSNIYLCEDLRLTGKKWVVKEMAAQYGDSAEQSKALEHFKREASLLANLEHRHLPKVIDYFYENGNYHFVMEYVEGDDLSKILSKSTAPLSEKQVIDWGMQIATVLYFLHCRKPNPIIFRDIKPSNIMVSGNVVKLIDMGIARHFTPGKKGDTMRIGSPGYAPPEQYSGQTDPRSDIYSLGVTLYQLLTKYDPSSTQTPFKFPPIRTVNPAVSQRMAEVIEKAIQIDPGHRYQTAIDLKKDLQSILGPDITSPASFNVRTVPNPTLPQSTVPQSNPPGATMPSAPPLPPQPPPATPPQQRPAGPPLPGKQGSNIAQKHKISALNKAPGKGLPKIVPIILILLLIGAGLFLLRNSAPALFGQITAFFADLAPHDDIKYNRDYPEDLLVRRSIKYMNNGEYLKAFENLDKVREGNPDDGEALLYLNNAYVLASAAEKFSIGVMIPTDGSRGNPPSRRIFMGLALAQQLINENGGIEGRKLLLIPRFHRNDGRKVTAIAKTFIESPETLAITGHLSDKELKSPAAIIGKAGLPVLDIDLSRLSESLPFFYFLHPPDNSVCAALGQVARDTIKPSSLAVIYEKDAERDSKEAFLSALGKDINTIECPYSSSDVKIVPIVEKLRKNNPSLIFLAGNPSGALERGAFETIIEALKKENRPMDFLVLPTTFYAWTINAPGGAPQGTLWSIMPSDPGEKNSRFYEFQRHFFSTFKKYPEDNSSAIAYDSIMMLFQGIQKNATARNLMASYLNDSLGNGSFAGASGNLQFKENKCVATIWFCAKRGKEAKITSLKSFRIP
jgi:eukaryotic-like serine/threonine-protein kinase